MELSETEIENNNVRNKIKFFELKTNKNFQLSEVNRLKKPRTNSVSTISLKKSNENDNLKKNWFSTPDLSKSNTKIKNEFGNIKEIIEMKNDVTADEKIDTQSRIILFLIDYIRENKQNCEIIDEIEKFHNQLAETPAKAKEINEKNVELDGKVENVEDDGNFKPKVNKLKSFFEQMGKDTGLNALAKELSNNAAHLGRSKSLIIMNNANNNHHDNDFQRQNSLSALRSNQDEYLNNGLNITFDLTNNDIEAEFDRLAQEAEGVSLEFYDELTECS